MRLAARKCRNLTSCAETWPHLHRLGMLPTKSFTASGSQPNGGVSTSAFEPPLPLPPAFPLGDGSPFRELPETTWLPSSSGSCDASGGSEDGTVRSAAGRE
jgi:hypothetical protein